MKGSRGIAMLLAAGMLGGSAAFAETVPDPDYSDVIVLYSDAADNTPSEDPLVSVINDARAAKGALPVLPSDTLNELAAQRVAELEQSGSSADANAVFHMVDVPASETVIRGKADLNTMISAVLLSDRQMQNLAYSRYAQFGYASNEAETLWVLLLTEAAPLTAGDE